MTAEKKIATWLFGVAGMVLAMAVIGAITRLTESGLSMVEWRPLIGTIPPISEAEWQRVFDIYRETPEYQKKNFGMSLDEFKTIFFWEWIHRLWGRLIGLALLVPLIWYGVRKQIPSGYTLKIFGVGCLVGLQAVMGWYMVASGLVDRPSVSHFRLAAHLSLAFVIFGCLLWLGFSLWGSEKKPAIFCIRRHGWTGLVLLAATIVWGAFVAGLDAGLVYNTYPLMDGKLMPTGTLDIINDHGWVQFAHRWLAIITGIFLIAFAFRIHSWPLAFMTVLQIGLGISTLITQVWLPLAAIHQAGALILFGILLFELFKLKRN